MAQPIVKYTLNKKGQVPEWIDTGSDSFSGEHAISGNKDGYIPRYESPQETIWLGIATGEADPDGTPDDYVGTISTKSALTTYLKTVGNTIKYKTVTSTVTGIQTATTTGLSTAWGQIEYSGGLSTSTTSKHTVSGVGTLATISTSQVTKVEVKTDTTEGVQPLKTTTTPIVIDAASTLSGVSTSVGIVTTTSEALGLAVTTTTTTDTTSYTYTDVVTSASKQVNTQTVAGIESTTEIVTSTETTNYETSYDYAAEATRLWDIYTALNSQ